MLKNLGKTLKQARNDRGISVKEISDFLLSKGYKASQNTIYSWENDNSQPTPDALLDMCVYYQIENPVEYFGFSDAATIKPQNVTEDLFSFSPYAKELVSILAKLPTTMQKSLLAIAKEYLSVQSAAAPKKGTVYSFGEAEDMGLKLAADSSPYQTKPTATPDENEK